MRLIVGLTILLLGGRIAEFPTPPFGNRSNLAPLQSACRALLSVLSGPVLERLGGTLLFSPQVDGGGDGGGGDGGGGDGGDGGDGAGTSGGGDGNGGAGTSSDGSTGGDSGTGEGNSGDSDSNGDGPGADPGAVGAPGDPGDPGSTGDAPAATDPSDPTTVSAIDNTEADVPTNDPALGLRGPGSSGADLPEGVGTIDSVGIASLPVSSGFSSVLDVGINAVIVSGARTPWEAVGRSSGVRNVIVKGGIIALGETALPPSPVGVTVGTAENPPEWLKFQPDLRYLNGSVFPPVVPNVIDIRTISNTEEAIGQPFK
jgi:hypothetical protein